MHVFLSLTLDICFLVTESYVVIYCTFRSDFTFEFVVFNDALLYVFVLQMRVTFRLQSTLLYLNVLYGVKLGPQCNTICCIVHVLERVHCAVNLT